ncbi:Hormone-sensitive lipase [Pleurostoma richardsiae]|uniref:Hormone-sensitive lipase n=1 Tax=Pleurostoma richardsiae TaxID=41990 RepID=A0AA38VVR1_9PEZI|nr:Hormone-sensitive lipase [Pleurostoma richardsiae]
MIDHVLGRPSVKSRRLQVLAVLAFWSAYLFRGHKHGPPLVRFFSKVFSKKLTAWQTVVITMIYLYAARNFSTLVGLASPEPLSNMYDATYFRATWVLTALDAGFWTAMKIRWKWLRDVASLVFSVFYMIAAEQADEKVRKVRGNLTVEHLRISWNKGTTPYLSFFQGLLRPRFTRWPPRAIRIPRPSTSDYKDAVSAWLYYDGPIADLQHHSCVVLDIPGGGYVAMDPRCNDDRLLAWAGKTGIPILSLDYKKAPEYPYPYALNECYDVYATLVKTKGRCIGMSGKEVPKIVVAGDSAGGGLAVAMTLMIIESGSSAIRRFQGQTDLPIPDGLILFYPGLDMNIGNWMSDEQMALIQDRRMRSTNKVIAKRKSMQYNDLVGTPHQSDDEDDTTPPAPQERGRSSSSSNKAEAQAPDAASPSGVRSPHPEYAHATPTKYSTVQKPHPEAAKPGADGGDGGSGSTSSYHSQPLRTRLAMSSMISYFNDRILTPEMMRAMIILYIGPHNRPDFSQDYLLSPILAPDLLLARFPKTWFLTGERDPLVDDTVIFAGRLRRVKAALHASGGARLEYAERDSRAPGFDDRDVAEVVLVPGISHGFMQFPGIYPPAWKWIDRSARWIEGAFAAAERRARQRRTALVGGRDRAAAAESAAQAAEAAGPAGTGRHHSRVESSGDEDRPLEIGMTKARAKAKASPTMNGTGQNKESTAAAGSAAGAGGDQVNGSGGQAGGGPEEAKAKRKKRAGSGRARKDEEADASLVKLASSDDLLGRRMQGLALGLAGVTED